MYHGKISAQFKQFQGLFFLILLLFPLTVRASFIESTQGTAVVNDATAIYYNPAALTLLKSSQFITLNSFSSSNSEFTGKFSQPQIRFTQFGSSHARTHYFLPSVYLALPASNKITLGIAVVSNFFNREAEDNSILRYAESSNQIENIDVVPALGIKLNEFVSLGAGVNFSYANFLLRPIIGFPSLNIPDSQSRNESNATSWGGDAGLLIKPNPRILIGLNYRSAISYHLKGTSVLEVTPELISNNYSFTFWTPARTVLSVNHFVTNKLGFIGTIQRIQWSIFKNINIRGVATQIGPRPAIINATSAQHLRNTWLLTLGSIYQLTPKWIIRVAGTYNQTAGNPNYQISNGDSVILGASMGYELIKNVTLDGSYAHVFMQNADIHIKNARNIITGVNKGSLNVASLKLALNL